MPDRHGPDAPALGLEMAVLPDRASGLPAGVFEHVGGRKSKPMGGVSGLQPGPGKCANNTRLRLRTRPLVAAV